MDEHNNNDVNNNDVAIINHKEKKFGFIITRHVNSPTTNKYWNQCVKCIRTFYPFVKIVIIDDKPNAYIYDKEIRSSKVFSIWIDKLMKIKKLQN